MKIMVGKDKIRDLICFIRSFRVLSSSGIPENRFLKNLLKKKKRKLLVIFRGINTEYFHSKKINYKDEEKIGSQFISIPFFKLKPSFIRIIDNEVAFGHKKEIRKRQGSWELL